MKKILGIALLVIGFYGASAQTNAIKINYLSPLVKTLNMQFERAVNENSTAQLGFYYLSWTPFNTSTKFSGWAITPEYRFYLGDTPAPAGFFIAPFVRFQSYLLEDTSSTDKGEFTGFQGGLIVGRQWVFKERITFETFLGPRFGTSNVEVTSGSNADQFDVGTFGGFGLRFGTTIGFAF